MSYIQVELDGLNKFPHVAKYAGMPVEHVSHGFLMLWSHCFRARADHVSEGEIVGFFGSKKAAEALCVFGFLEKGPQKTYRVKGAARYETMRAAKSEAGRKGRAVQLASRAAAGQVPGHVPSKSDDSWAADRSPVGHIAEQLTGQKRALYPRSEISSPNGEERSRRSEITTTRGSKPALEAQAAPRKGQRTNGKHAAPPASPAVDSPPRPPKPPPLQPGTPEYDLAVREDDWEALGWEPMR